MPSLRFIGRCIALVAGLFCGLAPAWSGEVLRVLAWPGYADEDFVRRFEKMSGSRVEVTLVGSDDALWEKVAANGGRNFDVFAVNTAELQRYIDAGLALALSPDEIPGIRRQKPGFQDHSQLPGVRRGGQLFAVPYTYAEMGLIYDRRAVPTPPDSLSVLWDPRYRGRVLAYDGSSHNFSLAAIKLGKASPFRLEPDDWAAAIDQLIALRRNVLTFYTLPEESVELFRQNRAAILFANYGTQQLQLLRDAGIDAGYVIPKEGALAWLDCWVVSAGSRQPGLAKSWIDFTLSPEMSGALSSRHGLGNTLSGAPKDRSAAPERLIWLQPVEDIKRRTRLWQRIISGALPAKVHAR